ncbi:hypothetical protein G6F56_006373 [Rhizopus delemar]|nr:hypothetical protein G6F56_006373 [Rhizopus delemar]
MQTSKEDMKLLSTHEEEEDDDDEEEPVFFRKSGAESKRSRRLTFSSSSPEPQPRRGRKRTILKPNKTDKAGRTKLFHFTSQGHLDKVKELVENGAQVNFKDNAGWTPLHEAALKGQTEIARYFIQCGADVNARGFGQDTPLHDASSNAQIDCIKLLLENGADVFALNESKQRPIDVCEDKECELVLTKKMKQLDRLIARDRDGRSLLHRACIENSLERVKSLLEQGADVNAKDNKEWTPLHLACSNGNLKIVKALIEQGAVVNILGSENMDTPLHQASQRGHEQTAHYLIHRAGVNVNTKNKFGQNAYDVSTPYPTIRQILTARMDEVRLEEEKCNALDEIARRTASRNEPERQLTREERKIQHVMRVFANLEGDDKSDEENFLPPKRKRRTRSTSTESDTTLNSSNGHRKKSSTSSMFDPVKKDSSGRTDLYRYAERGKQEMVQTLLEMGADPNERDNAGWTPIHEAALRGRVEIARLLLDHGANVNVKGGPDSDTPLHDATENNHCDVIEILLKHGANPLTENAAQLKPLDIAIENNYENAIKILRSFSPRNPRIKVEDETHIDFSRQNPVREILPKKKRLVQAADIKIEQEEMDMNPCSETRDVDPHLPILTPPPEPRFKQKERTKLCSPLCMVQLSNTESYVIDFQLCLFLGIRSTKLFWEMHPNLTKISIHYEQRAQLWNSLKPLLMKDEWDMFLTQKHYFVHYEHVIDLIKSDYQYLSQNLATVTLDLTERKKLPPKLAWKSNYNTH